MINAPRKMHILVVDDSEEVSTVIKDMVLEPAGYRVTIARDGVEGLQQALKLRPDLILLDYEMPRMNGIEVLKALKEQDVSIPVILITSYGSESVAVEVFRLGVRDYVPKPFSVEDILAAIKRALHEVQLERERDALMARLRETNAALSRRVKELDVLYHVSKSVTALQERKQLIKHIIDAALYLTNAKDGMLVLLDPDTGTPVVHIQRERRDKQCVTSGDLNILTNTGELIMSVPLRIGERTIGLLRVSNKRNRQNLNKKDERLLRMLADYAAIAIENYRLMSEIQSESEREKHKIRQLFEHYISPPVVARLLEQPQSVLPGGKLQDISLLFADLRGFTSFTAKASPETLVAVLNRHMAAAAEVIFQSGGTLDKFMGDEVMAFFNAPRRDREYALHAVQAAWRILEVTTQVHQQLPVQQRLDFGIGIATGPAIVGNIGSEHLVNYTAVGNTVNKAHTLQELAPANKIWICRHTFELVKDVVKARPLQPVRIKGQLHPEQIYEVVSVPQ